MTKNKKNNSDGKFLMAGKYPILFERDGTPFSPPLIKLI